MTGFNDELPDGAIVFEGEDTPREPSDDAPTPETPAYLRDAPPAARVYGTLSYNRRAKCWTIRGEPAVTELAKRLFPGVDAGRRGEARFAAHRRVVGDLNWLMLRYPLAVAERDAARWRDALSDARAYAARRERARLLPPRVTPPEDAFSGVLPDFQKEGTAFLCRSERCLLADEMGLGKTVQALAFLAETRGFPALIVPPAHLVRNWQAEIARFLHRDGAPLTVHVVRGLKPYPLPQADVYLMHYLLLRGWKETLPSLAFPVVVFDEVQELRHGGTEKYSAASLLSAAAERVVGLSGTPIYNRGAEIWHVVNALDYHFLGDFESFTREWCYGYGNQIVAKPEVLGAFLRDEGMMLRRTKEEVLSELPPKRRLVIAIDSDDAVYRAWMKPVAEKLRTLRGLRDAALPEDASRRALLESEIDRGERQATGIAKAPYVCQFVRNLLDAGERVLLFAHHHQVMDIVRKELNAFSPRFITGRETAAQKEASRAAFMDGDTNLCVISLRAASGLNLQRASCVVFGELDWSPAVHSQAEDRAHRIGQTDSLLCYYLVGGGCDEAIQDALGLKVSQFVALMGDALPDAALEQRGATAARRRLETLLAGMRGDEAG